MNLGTALLLAAAVGSGIMGDRLSAGCAALVAPILAFGPIMGAHVNPILGATGAPWLLRFFENSPGSDRSLTGGGYTRRGDSKEEP